MTNEFVKYPLTEGDFTEENLKYTIPAKDLFSIIYSLQNRIIMLELKIDKMQHETRGSK